MFHRKKTLKTLRYYKWKAWYKSFPNSGRKKICACSDYIPYTHHTSFLGARNIMHENVCVTIIKEERIENLHQIFFITLAYISQKANKLVCFVNNEGSVRYAIWCMISQKILTRCTFRGARVAPVKVSTKNKKLCTRISARKLPLCGLVILINMSTYIITIYVQKAGISKLYWKKFIQLLWTVVSNIY